MPPVAAIVQCDDAAGSDRLPPPVAAIEQRDDAAINDAGGEKCCSSGTSSSIDLVRVRCELTSIKERTSA